MNEGVKLPVISASAGCCKPFLLNQRRPCDTAPMAKKLSRTRNPACVLRLIEIGFDTRSKLLAKFGLKDPTGKKAAVLDKTLSELKSVGLVKVHESEPVSEPEPKFAVSQGFKTFQGTLDLSLKDLANVTQGTHMVVEPLWDPPSRKPRTDIFVVMPFRDRLGRIYKDHISTTAKDLGLSVERADERKLSGEIMKDVWESIAGCQVVIADCTGKNPNVFYEIGIAHTLGKKVILLTQKEDDVPFDIRHIRYIPYRPTETGLKQLDKRLRAALEEEHAAADIEEESQE